MKKNKNSELEIKKGEPSLKAKNKGQKIKSKNKKNAAQNNKLVKEKVDEVIAKDLVKVINAGDAINSKKQKGKKKKINKVKITQLKPTEGEVPVSNGMEKKEELADKDLTKIARKKAKKQLQKIIRQQKKVEDLKGLGSGNNKTARKDAKAKKKNTKQNETSGSTKKELASTETNEPKKINPKKQRKVEKKNLLKQLKDQEEPKKRVPVDFEVATVFVGNLPTNTKRVQLDRLFEKYGPIIAARFRTAGGKMIMKHKQRKEAGTLNAYVVLKDAATADMALELNGTEFKSNHLRVTRASKNAHNAGNADAKNMVFVGNLKYSATEEKLREIFSSCGDIEYVRCIHDGEKGCKGVAYVCFKAPDAVGLALELNETMLDERPIHVERYSAKKLGAKEARDKKSLTTGNKKTLTGAKKRLDNKKKQSGKISKPSEDSGDKKKSEFRGVKVIDIKKKQKKKKPSSQLKQIAKKIAPKTNNRSKENLAQN